MSILEQVIVIGAGIFLGWLMWVFLSLPFLFLSSFFILRSNNYWLFKTNDDFHLKDYVIIVIKNMVVILLYTSFVLTFFVTICKLHSMASVSESHQLAILFINPVILIAVCVIKYSGARTLWENKFLFLNLSLIISSIIIIFCLKNRELASKVDNIISLNQIGLSYSN